MRDVVAGLVAVLLVVMAIRMASSLQWYKRSHARTRYAIQGRGQAVVAEIPGGDGLRFFTEDETAFYWNERSIPKHEIRSTRVLISGAPLSARVSSRFEATPLPIANDVETALDGLERDRWDVAIDLDDESVLVECGAIRERVSQELARQVFDAVSRAIAVREQEGSSPLALGEAVAVADDAGQDEQEIG